MSSALDRLTRSLRNGSADSAAVFQGATHVVAVVAIVLMAISLALLSPSDISSAEHGTFEGPTPIEAMPFIDRDVDTSTASVTADEPMSACGPLKNTIWYALTLDRDTPLSVRVAPEPGLDGPFDVALVAWVVEADGSLAEIGCVDDRGADSPEQLVVAIDGEMTHYLQIGVAPGADGVAGRFSLLVDVQNPAHDLYAFARPVGTSPFRDIDVDSIDARREPGEPVSSCASFAATTWYRLSAPEDAILSASVVPSILGGSVMDFAVAVFAGDSIDSLVEVACVNAAGVQEPERVIVPVLAGTDYAIQVGTVLGQEAWPGFFSLAVGGRQSIELTPIPDTVFGADPTPLSATAISGLPVGFVTEGPCRILEGALVTDGAGNCTITATQPGDDDWAPAAAVSLAIDIARAGQSIELTPIPDTVFGADPTPLSATAISGLPVGFVTEGPCRILEGALVTDGAGNCTITATQPGDDDWAPAAAVSLAIDIARAGQSIELTPVDGVFVGERFLIDSSADSGLPVTLQTRGACIADGLELRPLGSGTCTITATQPGDDDWVAAESVTTSTRIGRGRQAIEFAPLPDTVFGADPVPLSATASSRLPVTLAAEGPCRLVEGALVTDGAGICTIIATQSGDIDWTPAREIRRTFRIDRAPQEIMFADIDTRRLDDPPTELDASSTSGLTVAFSATGACTINDGMLTLVDVGDCRVSAFQPGDADWAAAANVVRSFAIVTSD